MMFALNIPETLILVAFAALPLIVAYLVALPRRIGMIRRARMLLKEYPNAERTSFYFPFRSALVWGKEHEMDAKITEMAGNGWTFLKATEANPLRTIRSWGGGVMLHFIRLEAPAISARNPLPNLLTV